jgi:type IV pilus assembly protein PilW
MNNQHTTLRQAGFTLAEIMVGLAIGMLATLVILQVFSVFETQKRATTGTADAQTNGNIALYTLGRELQLAGYGLMPFGQPSSKVPLGDSAIECNALTIDGTADATTPNRLTPVVINDGASDTITIRYGNAPGGGIPSQIANLTANVATVASNVGCRQGDRTLVYNGANCAMSYASAVSASSSSVPATIELKDTTLAVNQANLACLGTWNEISYSASGGNLVRKGSPLAAGDPVVAGIVNIQAQYGVSATADSNLVTQWVDASGGTWAAPSVTDRNRIKAIHIAIVARNAKVEPNNVTSACTSVKGTANNGPCAWDDSNVDAAPAINLSNDADGTSWQRYRYRVFETIIPLRNVIWSQPTL